jgi:TonB-linked SusC/RagA family outer membrane protein
MKNHLQKHALFWKFMKVSLSQIVILFIISGISYAAESNAQEVLNKKITLEIRNQSLKTVLKAIEDQVKVRFAYSKSSIDALDAISISVKNVKLSELLDRLLGPRQIRYQVIEDQIIVIQYVDQRQGLGEKEAGSFPEAPDDVISGKVISVSGESIPGVNVLLKGTTIGTVTDIDGNYSLVVPDLTGTLVFSYIGYTSIEVPVDGKTTVDVTMLEDVHNLDEVVVVGYGTEKKVNLTGAVETIDDKKLTNRPIANLGQALQGLSPGLNVFTNNSGGQPDATMSFNIRGMGTPFVLVDNLPVDINQVNPQDIESISVVKDASAAAIYGANAPYGVILITTKKGKSTDGKPRLSYNNVLTMGTPTKLPNTTNSLDFAHAVNDAVINSGNAPFFTDAVIQRIEQYMADPNSIPAVGPDPIDPSKWAKRENANGNTDWYKELLKPWAFRQKHDLSLSGGVEKFTYYVSLGYFDHDGQLRYGDESYKRYNIDAKVGTKITDWLAVNFLTKFARSKIDYPNDGYGLDRSVMWHDFPRRFPTDPVKYPNGTWSEMSRFEIFENGGRELQNTGDFWTKIEAVIEPVNGWQIRGDYGWNNLTRMSSLHRAKINAIGPDGNTYIHFDTTPLNSIEKTFENTTYWNTNIYSFLDRTFGDHSFKLLVGHQREHRSFQNLYGYRDKLLTDQVASISTSTGTQRTDDNLTNWSTTGTFARINYNFMEKYLVEFNGRYQGSSRFQEGSRFGFFPSVSAGYRISEEPFWSGLSSFVNTLKLRGSYGSLGNHNVANFLHLPVMPVNPSVSWLNGNEPLVGVGAPGITSPSLTWETVTTIDVGFDATLLRDRLSVTFDYFRRTVSDMLGTPNPLPSLLGTGVPQENNAEQENKGWELALGWNDRIGNDFQYNLSLGVSDFKTVITRWNNPDKILSQNYEGRELGEIWGYVSNGLFQSAAEVAAAPSQSRFFANWYPGDVRYEDVNQDGEVDPGLNTLGDHGDLRIIGNSNPRYLYNINAGITYKNFDFSMLWNGVGQRDVWFNAGANYFWGHVSHVWAINIFEEHLDYYREDNTASYWPRPYLSSETFKNRQPSTRYLQSSAYLRLKFLQVGYTLPQPVVDKLKLSSVRVFFNGENLLAFTKLIDFMDPEATGGGWGQGKVYPLQKTLSLGLNVNF